MGRRPDSRTCPRICGEFWVIPVQLATSNSTDMKPKKVALAIDGGGVRGIIPARVITEIERRTAKHASSLFCLIAGSSIGAALGLVLAKPASNGAPASTAAAALDLLTGSFARVFPARWWHDWPVLGVVGSMLRHKYSNTGVRALLEEHFGETTMGQALTGVAVAAYDIGRGEPRVFTNLGEDRERLMSDVALATAAAPGFYPPVELTSRDGASTYVDSAVFTNNAAMIAYTELLRRGAELRDVAIVSISAGRARCRLDPEHAARWGFFHWGPNIVRMAVDGASRMADHSLADILGATGESPRYPRFEADIPASLEPLDNTASSNLAGLSAFADDLIRANDAEIDSVCRLLADSASDDSDEQNVTGV